MSNTAKGAVIGGAVGVGVMLTSYLLFNTGEQSQMDTGPRIFAGALIIGVPALVGALIGARSD